MRIIHAEQITAAVRELCLMAAFELPDDIRLALEDCRQTEPSLSAQRVIRDILENANIAKNEKIPICQDTGLAVF